MQLSACTLRGAVAKSIGTRIQGRHWSLSHWSVVSSAAAAARVEQHSQITLPKTILQSCLGHDSAVVSLAVISSSAMPRCSSTCSRSGVDANSVPVLPMRP